jgi:methyl-accepting chemotaxis protein
MLLARNIKSETIKISVGIVVSTVCLSWGLVFVANYGLGAVNTIQNLGQSELAVVHLDGKINSAISYYDLLGTGNAPDPMSILNSLKTLDADINALVTQIQESHSDSKELQNIIETNLPQVKTKYGELKSVGQEMVVDLLDDKTVEGKKKAQQLQVIAKALFEKIGTVSSEVPKIAAERSLQSANSLTQTRRYAMAAGAGMTLFLIFLITYFYSFLSRTLKQIMETLDSEVQRLQSNSTVIQDSLTKMNGVCTTQTESLNLTSSSVSEISAMSGAIVDSAHKLRELSQENSSLAVDGQNDVRRMAAAMENIMKVSDAFLKEVKVSTESFSQVVQIFQQIQEKTAMINEIVFQTKLLSFNASVEAARAGEYGKGFAVVAEEIGKLAHVSADAANEINRLLEGSHQRVTSIVDGVSREMDSMSRDSQKSLNDGFELAKECESRLQAIVEKVSEVSEKTNEIDTANREQSVGVHQIEKAIGEVKGSNDHVMSNLDVVLGSVEKINEQSKVLDSLVVVIKEKTLGQKSRPADSKAA